ncbi:MAG: prepilin-type N-terminal cleavage/methylation domain-containing protein [Gammaproteobacteria bacterium]|nr:prepilin-type N-terminal cleavage/methylation domain-containing protein [Gammaproteobacteria bacterium]
MRAVSSHRAPPAMSGFTLVEILLALTLMSMLLALAYGGLRASTRATDKGQTVLEDSSRIRMAHQFVRKRLNQAIPLAYAESEDGTLRTVFEGQAGKIRYVAPMPGYLGFGGPQVQELELVPSENGQALVLSHALLQGFEEANLYLRPPIVLVDNIASGEFSFLGRDENGELTPWLSTWEEIGSMPESVSLAVEFSEDVYIGWPLLTASIRLHPAAVKGAQTGKVPATRESYSTAIQDMLKQKREEQ